MFCLFLLKLRDCFFLIEGAVKGVVVGGFKLSAGGKSGKDQLFELVLSYFALLV